MHKFFTRDKAGSGFSSRFLFTAPENLAMPHWSASEIDPALTEQYEKAILRLLDREMGKDADGIPQPTEIGFTPEALQRMLSWHNDEYRPRTQEEMGDTYADACCKLDTYALRFALILEVMRAALEEREPLRSAWIRSKGRSDWWSISGKRQSRFTNSSTARISVFR